MSWDWAVAIDWHRAMVSENDKSTKKLIALQLAQYNRKASCVPWISLAQQEHVPPVTQGLIQKTYDLKTHQSPCFV